MTLEPDVLGQVLNLCDVRMEGVETCRAVRVMPTTQEVHDEGSHGHYYQHSEGRLRKVIIDVWALALRQLGTQRLFLAL